MEFIVNNLSSYEEEQIKAIRKWKGEEPDVIIRSFGIATEPIAWIVKKIVLESSLRKALDFSNSVAELLTDSNSVIKSAGVTSIKELRNRDLQLSDKLADDVRNWAIGIATAEGFGTGIFGILGAPVDVPAIIIIALRTIHKTGVCYGYECSNDFDRKFVLGILAASGANSAEEKTTALKALQSIELTLAEIKWAKMAEKALEAQLNKAFTVLSVKNLARQLMTNITKRRVLASIPIIGAAIGGSVNGWFVKEVSRAAKCLFQERWLLDNRKITDLEKDA